MSRSPSASLSSLDLSLQVHLQTRLITASKYIFKERWQLYRDTAVTEVARLTGTIYSADPGVDRHHLISISSYHTMEIHTISFPTLVSLAVFEISWSHAVAWIVKAGFYHIISPDSNAPRPRTALMNSVWMLREVWRSVDGGLSAF